MTRFALAYAATLVTMLAIDLLWLGVIARSVYTAGIGHLMAAQPNLAAAVAFYLIYPLGLVLLAVLPHGAEAGWRATAVSAALFGFFAYATYDLSNLATLRAWPVGLTLIDMAWGTLLSTAAAVVGKLVWDRMAAA
jgi:uncharacterized membrane protein